MRYTLPCILLAGFLLKLPALFHPLIGHFGSYQAVNAMMAVMMNHSPEAYWIPQTFILMEGKPALHLLYYPFASLLASLPALFLGGELDFWGRFQAAMLMLGAGWILYHIVKKYFSRETALTATFIFTFSPMVLISGISFQNEAAAIFFLVASFWLLIKTSAKAAFLAGIVFSLGIVARLHFVLIVPAFLAAIWMQKTENRFLRAVTFFFGAAIPVTGWYGWMTYLELSNSHVMTGFLGQMGEGRVLIHPIFKDSKFYIRLVQIVSGPWLTPISIPFLVLGFLTLQKRTIPFALWVLGSLFAILLLPKKVFDHPFYLISALPAASVLIAVVLHQFLIPFSKKLMIGFFILFILFSCRFYLPPAFAFSPLERRIPEIGKQIQELTQPQDSIIASYGSSSELLYYSRRMGWTFFLKMQGHSFEKHDRILRQIDKGYGDPVRWLEHLREEGARYLIITEKELFREQSSFFDHVTQNYNAVPVPGDAFLMFQLGSETA